jgi:hypothetical protein
VLQLLILKILLCSKTAPKLTAFPKTIMDAQEYFYLVTREDFTPIQHHNMAQTKG